MPRQPRYFIPGIPQHVIQRGVDRQAVFFETGDYQLYLDSLCEAARRYECQIHAYVLMTNHVHLLVTPGDKRTIPLVMQAMGRSYVQRLNKKYDRTGTLWQGRYKASLVQDDVYMLACYKYIELNPVRAGLVSMPGDYPHSSYAHNANGDKNELLKDHKTYELLSATAEGRRNAYRNLCLEGVASEMLLKIRESTNACLVMGNDRFKDEIEIMLGRSVRPGKNGRPVKQATEGCQ